LLATAGKAEDLKQGVEMALATLGSGGALTTLNGLVEITNG
jgi:anthranilate phosphoribosyltransferase